MRFPSLNLLQKMKRDQADEQIEWFGDYGYKFHKGQLWMKCPKANGVEMAWRLESEIGRDNTVLGDLRQYLSQQEEEEEERKKKKEEEDEEEEEVDASTGATTGATEKEKKKVLIFKGCKTWKEYRAMCHRTAQQQKPNADGLVPCYGCPCCNWTSEKQDWGAAEFSLSVHTETKSENETPYLKSQDKRDRLKVVHPGKEWLEQSATTGPGFEKHERQLEEAGMGKKREAPHERHHEGHGSRPKEEKEWGPKAPKEEPPRVGGPAPKKKTWVPIKKEEKEWEERGGRVGGPSWETQHPIWVDPRPEKKTHGVGSFEEWQASEQPEGSTPEESDEEEDSWTEKSQDGRGARSSTPSSSFFGTPSEKQPGWEVRGWRSHWTEAEPESWGRKQRRH